jgi:cytidine deaminase
MSKNKPTVEDLIHEARKAQLSALAPHSNYAVGATILTSNFSLISGFNIESKVYPSTMCAERVAIFSALSQGHSSFSAIAIITDDGGMPCGSCLQLIHEFMGNIQIHIADKSLKYKTYSTQELLPHPFG